MIIFLSGCATNQVLILTPLQIKLMQIKVFNVDKCTAFNATVTVIQNLGYIIQDTNFNTEIITAKNTKTANFLGDTQYTESTAFIQIYKQSDKSSIRINFVIYNSMPNPNQSGALINTSSAVLDPQAYKNAFAKI